MNTNNFPSMNNDQAVTSFLNSETNKLEGTTTDLFKANLRNIGFRLAGISRGSIAVLKTGLARLRATAIEDAAKDKAGQEEFKESLRKEIQSKELDIADLEKKITEKIKEKEIALESNIPQIQNEIKELEDSKVKLETEVAALKDEVKKNPFTRALLWTLFITGTLYLYMFYVSAGYSALFRSITNAISGADGATDIDQLINSLFVPEAYGTLNFHWALPIAFFVIGVVLHFALDVEGWKKYLAIPFATLMVIGADGLLAFFMEKKSHLVGYYLGTEPSSDFYFFEHALNEPGFYFILTLGSISVICWTLIVHKLQNMYSNEPALKEIRTKTNNINKKIKKLNTRLGKEEATIKEIEGVIESNEIEIKSLRDQILFIEDRIDRVTYSPSRLATNLLAFYQGWMQYISALQDHRLSEKTDNAFKECIEDMDLEVPGYIVKNISETYTEAA